MRDKGLGISVGSENVEDLKTAILKLAEDAALRAEMRRRVGQIKKGFYWDVVTEPLVTHCRNVLAGEVKKMRTPSPKDLAFSCGAKGDSFMKRTGKKYFWTLLHRLPFQWSTRLKRWFRT